MFFVANSISGNSVSAYIAKSKAQSYINDKYSHLDLEIKNVGYNLKDDSYFITVNSRTSIDTHFHLSYKAGKIIRDDYALSVLSGMNTMDRFCDEYKRSLTSLVQAKVSEVTNIFVIPEKLTKYNISLDSPFDKRLVENVDISISCIGGTNAEHLALILKQTYNVMKENGYVAANFAIRSEHETALTELMNIKPVHIESENFEEILQQAIAKTEYDGIFAFSKGPK